MSEAVSPAPLADAYRGRRVLLVGGTGFLGSVTVSLLLHRLPELERLFLVLRRRPGLSAERRFYERILPGVPFEPLRQRFGEAELARLLEEKVQVLEGDLSLEMLGLSEEELGVLDGRLDLVLNCSGLVDFHAPLERAYRVNVLGTRHLLALCERTGAALVHTSTAFVAGRNNGRVGEEVEEGYFPRRAESPFVRFDPEREIADLREELETIQVGARSQQAHARFTEQAIERYREANDGLPSPGQLENAVRRAARDHLAAAGVEAGRRRAEFWGWPNVYTYSKAIGEQLIARSEVRAAIVRPTIIESALQYPVPGWNQNATTSAPLVMLALAGYGIAPASADHVIDLIPVDQVAWALLAVGAATLAGRQEQVYQIGTSDANPLTLRRLTDLVGIYTHARALDEGEGSSLGRLWKGNSELHVVQEPQFRRRIELMDSLSRAIVRNSRRWSDRVRHRKVRTLLESLAGRAETYGEDMKKAVGLWDVFLPFLHDLDYRFETGNIRALAAEMSDEAEVVAFGPSEIDWRRYWLEIHIPGLRRWVLADTAVTRPVRQLSAAIPLTDRFEALAERDGYRRALTFGFGARPSATTYGEMWSAAGSLAKSLQARGDDTQTIGVVTNPLEPWPIALLAVLRAGHDAVLIPTHAWSDSLATLQTAGVSTCVRMPRPGEAQLLTPREQATGVSLERVPGSVPNPAGVASTPRGGAVSFLGSVRGGWEIVRRLDQIQLSRELAELGETLALRDDARAVLPVPAASAAEAGALTLLNLTLLYHGARTELVQPLDLDEVVREVRPSLVVLSTEAWGGLHQARDLSRLGTTERIVDLAARPAEELRPLNHGEVRVVRLVWDEAVAAASASLLPLDPSAEPPESARVSSRRGGDLVRIGAVANGRPHVFPTAPVLSSVLVRNGRSGGRILVVPELTELESLQELRERILEDVARYNSAVELSGRVAAVGVSLLPRHALADEVERDGRVLWLGTRRRDRGEDDVDPELLLRESVLLFGGIFDAGELDFFVRHLLREPLTRERLLIWERVLLRGARRGELPAQVFLQSFDLEWERTRTVAYRAAKRAGAVVRHVRDWTEDDEPSGKLIPEPVSAVVRAGIGAARSAFFRYGLRTTVYGAAYVPANENFLVVANHSSHLDAGVIHYSLGAWSERLHTLAAKDYFFSTPGRRIFSHHFTRLIPLDRRRVSSEWLRRARDLLAGGECILIFPEGTRSTGPEVRPFKASIGTLVRSAGVPVLPIYVAGTDQVLPKGRVIPRGREVRVHIGPPIPAAVLAAATAGVPGLKQDRALALLLQKAVASVPERDFWWLRPDVLTEAPLLLPRASQPEGVHEEEVAG